MSSNKCDPLELFGQPLEYGERKFRKRKRMTDLFSCWEVSEARRKVMATDEYLKGAEELEYAMPKLLVKTVSSLSEQCGGNLGWRGTLNGIKANISWCIGHGFMEIHDNYVKPLTGYYVNSANVSAGKSLDKNMHEEDIMAVSGYLFSLQYDLAKRLAQKNETEFKESPSLVPITKPGSMAGLESDLNENQVQILLSDEWCRTMDNLQLGGGDKKKAVTSALAPLVDLEACRSYRKRFKVASGVDIPQVGFYTMLYGQDVPIINFLVGRAGETGLATRFRTTIIQGGDRDYGTN